MLNEEEKSKIKAEEIFRDEIRKSLNSERKNRLWLFLNSGLGLWFLSTIVIGLSTYFFNNYRENLRVTNQRNDNIHKLDLEIESRISQFWVHLDPLVNQKNKSFALKKGVESDTIKVFWEVFKSPPSFNPKLMTTIYKEYETRTTISLMIELSSLLQEKYKISTNPIKYKYDYQEIKPVTKEQAEKYREIKKIDEAAVFIAGNGIYYKSNNPSIREMWESFSSKIITDRWNYSFPYTDCLFC